MTRPKTSIEKLETRNEKVTDLKSALNVSRWKWEEVNTQAYRLWDLINHYCGFCMLAMNKITLENLREGKCRNCPKEVSEECDRVQKITSEIQERLDAQIGSTQAFLEGLKY